MPTDDLHLEKPGEGGEGDPKGTDGNGKDPAGNAGLTMAEAAELITQANAPLLEKVAELTASMGRMNQPTPKDPVVTPVEPADFLTRFSEDPEGAIDARIASQFQTVAPVIGNIINSGTGAFVGLEAQQVDQEFGEGAWAKYIDKPLTVILDSYKQSNAAALSDRGTITREVNGLKGQLLNELVEHRDTSKQKATEAGEASQKDLLETVMAGVRTNLTGGIRSNQTVGEEVTEELKGYLAERQAAIGGDESGKDWLQRTDYGNTIEEYVAHQKKLETAAGGK